MCAADERIVAAFLGGSLASERADEFSDVDLCVIARDDVFDDVVRDRTSLIEALGEPVFVEDFGHAEVVSFVLADGTEAEIFFGREGALAELRPGRHRTLFDRSGILEGVTFEEERADPEELEDVLRRTLSWFWHELSHFVKAIGRNQLWWAAGQLEALRDHCVNLVRIEQGRAGRRRALLEARRGGPDGGAGTARRHVRADGARGAPRRRPHPGELLPGTSAACGGARTV